MLRGECVGLTRTAFFFFSSLLVTYFAYAPSRLLLLLVLRYVRELRRPVTKRDSDAPVSTGRFVPQGFSRLLGPYAYGGWNKKGKERKAEDGGVGFLSG